MDYFRQEVELARLFNPLEEDIAGLYEKVHGEYDPVFVLSTGRCGTKLLSGLLQLNSRVAVYHGNTPELTWYSGYAFQHFKTKDSELKTAIDLARYEQIRNEYLLGKKYIETNNRITFFAHQLAELYPRSKFIHLYRDVYKVVKSGNSRNWYGNDKLIDEGKIRPLGENTVWEQFSQVEKIAWMWNETNRFADDFKKTVEASRVMTIEAEELFLNVNQAKAIFSFCGLEAPASGLIAKTIHRPVNKQSAHRQRDLTENDRDRIGRIVTWGMSGT